METLEPDSIQEQNSLLAAIENTDICTFWYYPKEKRITVNERTARIYNCKREYTDMPELCRRFRSPVHPAGFLQNV